jgi:hypothetical protein
VPSALVNITYIPTVKDYKIKKAIKLLNILKKEFVKIKSYYNKTAKRVITLFKQLVYYNYNKVKFGEFKHIKEKRLTKLTNMSF